MPINRHKCQCIMANTPETPTTAETPLTLGGPAHPSHYRPGTNLPSNSNDTFTTTNCPAGAPVTAPTVSPPHVEATKRLNLCLAYGALTIVVVACFILIGVCPDPTVRDFFIQSAGLVLGLLLGKFPEGIGKLAKQFGKDRTILDTVDGHCGRNKHDNKRRQCFPGNLFKRKSTVPKTGGVCDTELHYDSMGSVQSGTK